MVRESIGPYRILRKLGEGGMGEVYEAMDDRIKRRVAIKLLRSRHLDDPETAARFFTEALAVNLTEHPVAAVREIADEVGAVVLFDAAHACGLIAGGVWANPLDEGAHMMTFSTYKSLGGPAGGVVVTNDAKIAERLDHIAYPGLTANFDAAKTATLAVTMVDWKSVGAQYAEMMVANSLNL